jgi:TPR repeat protein
VLKAQIKADPDDVLKSLNKMFNERQKEQEISQLSGDLSKMQEKNNSIVESLTESRKEATAALDEIARLKKQLAEKQTEQSTQSLKVQYQHQVDILTVNEWFNSGLNERNLGNYTQAMTWFRKVADAGNDRGMTQLGILYEQGNGVKKNDSEAF